MRRSRLDSDGHLPSASASLAPHGAHVSPTRRQTAHAAQRDCTAWQDPDSLQTLQQGYGNGTARNSR